MNTKLELAFFVFTIASILIGGIWIFATEKRLKKFFLGKKAKDLEETIDAIQDELRKLTETRNNMQKEIAVMNSKIRKSVRGLEVVRFNPFSDQGSNQSFAIGMLNEEGDGVVFSSLFSRERMSVFAKPIKNNQSEYELTEEERTVLEKSKVK